MAVVEKDPGVGGEAINQITAPGIGSKNRAGDFVTGDEVRSFHGKVRGVKMRVHDRRGGQAAAASANQHAAKDRDNRPNVSTQLELDSAHALRKAAQADQENGQSRGKREGGYPLGGRYTGYAYLRKRWSKNKSQEHARCG